MGKKLAITAGIASVIWLSVATAFDGKAETMNSVTIPLVNGELTQEGSDIINMIPIVKNRPDMDFFLLHPDKYPQEFCLAQNIFFEAGIDHNAGKAAVADVTLNRVNDNRYPNTVCEVVYDAVMKESWKTKQHPDLDDSERVYIPVRNKCQFSWFCDGKPDDVPLGSENWVRSQMVAWEIMHGGRFRGITEGATHYHATYVNPGWNKMKNLDLVGRIGKHIFYRWNQ